MKKPIIPKTLLLLFLPFLYFTSIAQKSTPSVAHERFGLDGDIGLAVPVAGDINTVFYTGGNISLGGKIAVLRSKKLWIKPTFGVKIYSKPTGSADDKTTESFNTVKAGIELQYKAAQLKKFAFYPLLRVDNNWCSNYFSKTYDETQVGNVRIVHVGVSDKYLKGTGISFDAGVMFVHKSHWYLKADYEYFRPSLTVYPDLVKEAQTEGIYIPSTVRLNCSTINIGIGANFNFR